jgi:hypothetical protein
MNLDIPVIYGREDVKQAVSSVLLSVGWLSNISTPQCR